MNIPKHNQAPWNYILVVLKIWIGIFKAIFLSPDDDGEELWETISGE